MARKTKEKEPDIGTEAPDKVAPPIVDITPPPITEVDDSFIKTESATGTTPPPVNAGAESVRGTLSPSGEPFDPAVHVYPPSATTKGVWRKRKQTAQRGTESLDDLPNANYRREAEKAAALYAAMHTALLGNDARPEDGDLLPMVDAWESYFQSNGLKQVPPWAALLLTKAAYTHAIVSRPAIWPRVKAGGLKVLSWFGFKVKKPDAHVDSGQQLQRQDDARKDTGSAS